MLEQFSSKGHLGLHLIGATALTHVSFNLWFGNFTNIILSITVSLSLEFFFKKIYKKIFPSPFRWCINKHEWAPRGGSHMNSIWYAHNIFLAGQCPPTKWLHIYSYFSLWSPFEKQRGITETTWRVDTKVSSWIRICQKKNRCY